MQMVQTWVATSASWPSLEGETSLNDNSLIKGWPRLCFPWVGFHRYTYVQHVWCSFLSILAHVQIILALDTTWVVKSKNPTFVQLILNRLNDSFQGIHLWIYNKFQKSDWLCLEAHRSCYTITPYKMQEGEKNEFLCIYTFMYQYS